MKDRARSPHAKSKHDSAVIPIVMKYRQCCKYIRFFLEEGKVGIRSSPEFRTYHIQITTHGALQEIRYCPWCGIRFPKSLWGEWFRKLAAIGIEFPYETPKLVPKEMRSEAWWINRPIIPAARKQRVKA